MIPAHGSMPGERPVKVTMTTLSLSCRKHGVCVDSRADLYGAEVSYTVRGSHENPPCEPRSFQKFVRQGGYHNFQIKTSARDIIGNKKRYERWRIDGLRCLPPAGGGWEGGTSRTVYPSSARPPGLPPLLPPFWGRFFRGDVPQQGTIS